jgi:hypothetical protein
MTCHEIESETAVIESKRLVHSDRKISDAALDGLFGGLAAGVTMAIYLLIWGLTVGMAPSAVLGMFDPAERGNPAAGALTHLAVASVYGILFGLIWWALRRTLRLRVPAWLAGVVYGLLLLLVAKAVVLPAAGSPLADIPALHFAAAHMIYGAALGYLNERIGGWPA